MSASSAVEISPRPRDLAGLVSHRESVPGDTPLEEVQRAFARNGRDFLAVVEGDTVIGVCARRDVGMLMGARFGFALHARHPVRQHLVAAPLIVRQGVPITVVLQDTVARSEQTFFDDVVLVDDRAALLGLIPMHTLVRVQDDLLREKIGQLEKSEADIRNRNRELEQDLQMAHKLQLAMLPHQTPPELDLRIEYRYLPCGGVSGDSFDLIRFASGEHGVFVCDVMGHGVRAALITAMVRTLMQGLAVAAAGPADLFTRLNRQLGAILRQSAEFVFVTAAMVSFRPQSRALHYVQAGHPTPLVWRRHSATAELLPISPEHEGPALGLLEGFVFSEGRTPVASGDRVLLFTDGLIEAEQHGDPFGLERTRAAFARTDGLPLARALDALVDAAKRHAGDGFSDDVCVVGIELE